MTEKTEPEIKTEEEPPPIIFSCSNCKLTERVDYHGSNPKFAKKITLKEPCYVMQDPFSQPGKGQILVIGSDCSVCGRMICVDKTCSLFYTKTFCNQCAKIHRNNFPDALLNKIKEM